MLTVTDISEYAALDPFEAEWRALVAESPDGSFFETPEWIRGWTKAFWAPRRPAFMFVRDGGRLVGFAPLLDDEEGDGWCRGTLALPHHSHIARTNVVAAAGRRAEVLDAILAHATALRGIPRISFAGIDRETELWADVAAAAGRNDLQTMAWPGPKMPWVRISGTWDDYLQTRSSHLRSELRRKRRKLEKAGRLEVRVASSPEEQDTAVRDIMAIERKSWKQPEGTSMENEPGAAELYVPLAGAAAERGWLRLYVMSLNGEPIAHLYGVVFRNEYLALKTSYDQATRELSPGAVLFEHVLHDAFDQGYDAFDMLGVEARWKNELATDSREPMVTCVFASTSLTCRGCRSLECTVKPMIRRHAPWIIEAGRRAKAIVARPPQSA